MSTAPPHLGKPQQSQNDEILSSFWNCFIPTNLDQLGKIILLYTRLLSTLGTTMGNSFLDLRKCQEYKLN